MAINLGMAITLTSGALATLLEEATHAGARECCGLLLGQAGRITRAVAAANVHPDPARHFEIDPAVLIAAHRAARGGAAAVLGYYHSHPTGLPEPSPTDRAMASGDGRIWAIIAGGTVRLWRDDPEGFEPLPTRVADG